MVKCENVYNFISKCYDIGDKLGFLNAIIEFALRRDDLVERFSDYLKDIVKEPK